VCVVAAPFFSATRLFFAVSAVQGIAILFVPNPTSKSGRNLASPSRPAEAGVSVFTEGEILNSLSDVSKHVQESRPVAKAPCEATVMADI
jgi:F0F1-type ATP synthase assembly protein I